MNIRDWFTRSHASKGGITLEIARVNEAYREFSGTCLGFMEREFKINANGINLDFF
jgi:hypothetical protein